MKVAVCDDLPGVLEEVKKVMEQIDFVKEADYYSNIGMFYSELKQGVTYDAVLLDIDWKEQKTGIDFAEELLSLCPDMRIIYITAYTLEYVEDIFLKTSNLSGFLMKPLKLEQLIKLLEKVRRENKNTEGKLVIRYKGNLYAISHKDIIYLESQLHKVHVILKNSVYECTEKLEIIKGRLSDKFLVCHKSYIVNMDYIQEFSSEGVLLNTGQTIQVSKKRYGEAKKYFFAYLFEKM